MTGTSDQKMHLKMDCKQSDGVAARLYVAPIWTCFEIQRCYVAPFPGLSALKNASHHLTDAIF